MDRYNGCLYTIIYGHVCWLALDDILRCVSYIDMYRNKMRSQLLSPGGKDSFEPRSYLIYIIVFQYPREPICLSIG